MWPTAIVVTSENSLVIIESSTYFGGYRGCSGHIILSTYQVVARAFNDTGRLWSHCIWYVRRDEFIFIMSDTTDFCLVSGQLYLSRQ